MQWTPGLQSGFSTNANTWLPVAADYKTVNVQTESTDPTSQLTWYERLIQFRRTLPALADGTTVMLDTTNPNVLSYLRTAAPGSPAVLVTLNLSRTPQTVTLNLDSALTPAHLTGAHPNKLLTDTELTTIQTATPFTLPPYGTFVETIQ